MELTITNQRYSVGRIQFEFLLIFDNTIVQKVKKSVYFSEEGEIFINYLFYLFMN